MKTALVGCGKIAFWHVSAIQEIKDVDICGVFDRDIFQARRIARLTDSAKPYNNYEELIQKEKPDVVHILTPPSTHAELAIKAMESGCHVFVEKPMAINTAETDQMLETSKRCSVILSTNHNYLFKPSFRKAKQLVKSGQIGQVTHVNSFYGLSGGGDDYKVSGGHAHWAWEHPLGAFINFLPHLIYLQLEFLSNPICVAGVTANKKSGKAPVSELNVLLHGANTSGTMTFSTRTNPYVKFVDIYGTEGIIHIDLSREVCIIQRKTSLPSFISKASFNLEKSLQLATKTIFNIISVLLGNMQSYAGLHQHVKEFYASIKEHLPPPVSGEDGKRTLAIMDEIHAKAKNSSISFSLPLINNTEEKANTRIEEKIIEQGDIPGKALVTGATGFLGYHLVNALSRCGTEVVAMVRDPHSISPTLAKRAEIVCGDLRNRTSIAAAMHNVDYVFHCAAVTTNKEFWINHNEINIKGTKNILEEAHNENIKRIIYVSSVIVYGLNPPREEMPIHETYTFEKTPNKWAYYMRSKLEADRLALKAWADNKLPIVILRPGILYGPGSGLPANGLFEIGSIRFFIGNGRNKMPYTYIDNAVDALLLAAVIPDIEGQAFNIVDEPQVTPREVISITSQIIDKKIKVLPVHPLFLNSIATVLETKSSITNANISPKLTRYVTQSSYRDVEYSTQKARDILGWQPGVRLEEGLRQVVRSRSDV